MKKIRNLAASLAVLFLALILPIHAEQLDYIDLNHPGTLMFRIHTKNGTTVPGGSITIYRVADLVETEEGWIFKPNAGFSSLENLEEHLNNPLDLNSSLDVGQHINLAKQLLDHALKTNLKGETEKVPANGIVGFDTKNHDIRLGLYLVTQQENAPGYSTMPPFLISIPQALYSDTYPKEFVAYEYDVVATPKADPDPLPESDDDKEDDKDTPPTSTETGWTQAVGLMVLSLLFFFLLRKARRQS